jgi:hypothetical protein
MRSTNRSPLMILALAFLGVGGLLDSSIATAATRAEPGHVYVMSNLPGENSRD